MVSPNLASKLVVGFWVEPQNQGGEEFPGLCLKTNNSGLVIWASKSPRRFLGLGLKITWRKVLLNLWSLMAMILITGKTGLTTIS
jgi:hypothetical protein